MDNYLCNLAEGRNKLLLFSLIRMVWKQGLCFINGAWSLNKYSAFTDEAECTVTSQLAARIAIIYKVCWSYCLYGAKYMTHPKKALQHLVVSHAVPSDRKEVTAVFWFISECTVQ